MSQGAHKMRRQDTMACDGTSVCDHDATPMRTALFLLLPRCDGGRGGAYIALFWSAVNTGGTAVFLNTVSGAIP